MDCTYHRLSTNKANDMDGDRKSSQIGQANGNIKDEDTSSNGLGLMNLSSSSAFSSYVPTFQSSPSNILSSQLNTSPTMTIYSLQNRSSSQDRLNHISSSAQPNQSQAASTSSISFDPFSSLPTPGPSLLDLPHSTTNQSVFKSSLDMANSSDADAIFSSSDTSDMIFNSTFGAEDTFFSWKPFEYNVNNDASLDFLFGPDLGIFDSGFSPENALFGDNSLAPTATAVLRDVSQEHHRNSENEEVPDEGIVATFDPGTGDGADEHGACAPSNHPSRTGACSTHEPSTEYLQLIQIDPLQARCNSLITAVFGTMDSLRQQDPWIQEFFTKDNIKSMLFHWAKRYAQHVPIVHIPTFSILTSPDALLFILCVIGRAYASPGIDTDKLQLCIEIFDKLSSMARVKGELDMENLEAVYILVVLCTWHGNKHQRDMARRLYIEVVEMAKRYGYCKVMPKKKTDGSDEAEWRAWIEQETRIRYSTFIGF
jgi:hypothetical protein